MAQEPWVIDPDDVLDFKFDWSDWLPDGDVIIDHTVTVADGVVLNSSSITNNGASITIWVTAPDAEDGDYDVLCHVITQGGREVEWNRVLSVVSQGSL